MSSEEEEPDRRNDELILLGYQQSLQKYHNQRVRGRALSVRDFVLKEG
jgi:hypothetical protein